MARTGTPFRVSTPWLAAGSAVIVTLAIVPSGSVPVSGGSAVGPAWAERFVVVTGAAVGALLPTGIVTLAGLEV